MPRLGTTVPGTGYQESTSAVTACAAWLAEPDLWAQVKESYTARFRDRDPQDTIDQWQACLDFDDRGGVQRRRGLGLGQGHTGRQRRRGEQRERGHGWWSRR